MELFEAIHTQRAIRRFRPNPISEDSLYEVLNAAIRAPSGGNSQPWFFLGLRDKKVKQTIQGYCQQAWEQNFRPDSSDQDTPRAHMYAAAGHLAAHLADAPVLIIPCIEHDNSPSTLLRGSSIYPAVQNLLLAARGLGIGTTLTTFASMTTDTTNKIKTFLKVPDNVDMAALIPMGYPAEGEQFGGAKRKCVEDVTYWDLWGSPAFSMGSR